MHKCAGAQVRGTRRPRSTVDPPPAGAGKKYAAKSHCGHPETSCQRGPCHSSGVYLVFNIVYIYIEREMLGNDIHMIYNPYKEIFET